MYEHFSLSYRERFVADRQDQLRRAAGAARLRHDFRRQQHRRAPSRSR